MRGRGAKAETKGMTKPKRKAAAKPKQEASATAPRKRDALVSVKNLSVDFSAGGKVTHAVRNVSFDVGKGETVALVGESGSGKTVTALSILQLLPYPAASHPSGVIEFQGKNLMTLKPEALRRIRGNDISMIFQEPMTSLNPLHTIEDQVGEVLKIHRGLSNSAVKMRVLDLLTKVGIDDPESRLGSYPHQLSGGQRQRVMIAMALANEPALLIADEPTTALDVTIQAQILDLLSKLKDEFNMAMLLITHNLGIVRKMADRVCVMNNGEIVEAAPTQTLFASPQHPYTKHLLASEPKGKPPVADETAPTVLEARDLKVWFPIRRGFLRHTVGHIKAVDGIDLAVKEGQTLGVVGESGSGKTTLGLALLRLISSNGPIVYLGNRIDGFDSRQMRPLRRDMQIVFQDPYGSLSPRLSIGQIIEEGLLTQKPVPVTEERRERVARALREVGLDPAMQDRYPHEFSGGQRQRIAIARALVLEPKFLILDEPTSALDVSVQAQIVDLLRDLQARHKLAYLFISHDLKVVRALANEVIVLRHGKVVEQGPARELFANPQTPYTKALLAAAFELEATHGGVVAK
jgi:microcin C transport system ATP-binding protein